MGDDSTVLFVPSEGNPADEYFTGHDSESTRKMNRPLRIFYADGPGAPRTPPKLLLLAAGYPSDIPHEIFLGWTIEPHPWLQEPNFKGTTLVAGYALTKPINEGRVTALTMRLSAIGPFIEANPPDIALISGVPRGSGYAHGASVGSNDVLARHSRLVVIEVDNESPDLGGPLIEGNIIATISRPPAGLTKSVTARPPDDIDALIGKRVVELLPDEPTMQFGSGGFGDGIAASIQRPISIWSGLATESMAQLNARGLLTGPITAAYAWGADALLHLAQSKMLRLVSVTETHDLTILSSKPRFVSCNTALQVSLDGDVNVERIGGRIIAPLGGHADFCTGASRSVGGMSIIAVRSTTANGISNIVNRCEVVSTARSDIQFVVTEHGVADLRDINDAERSRRLINIAAPEHRAMLANQREITF